MLKQLDAVVRKFKEIEAKLGSGSVQDPAALAELSKEHSDLSKVVTQYLAYQEVERDLDDAQIMANDDDPDMAAMAAAEVESLKEKKASLYEALELTLIPKDPNDSKSVYLEIRAGTGGEEAALFAADLFRMYSKFAEKNRWKVTVNTISSASAGGFKEVVAHIEGTSVFASLKFESGIHRVQRVPATETQGRVHTSAVTVAVLPEIEDVEIDINPSDLRIDVYRSSGAGGQHVNTTDSAVRITHIPTDTVVTCQDARSQIKNRESAMKELKSRIYEKQAREQSEKLSQERKSQVGSGDRSEKIRTYNYPQSRLTDHRINLTLYKLDTVMNGELDEVITSLTKYRQAILLQESKSQ